MTSPDPGPVWRDNLPMDRGQGVEQATGRRRRRVLSGLYVLVLVDVVFVVISQLSAKIVAT